MRTFAFEEKLEDAVVEAACALWQDGEEVLYAYADVFDLHNAAIRCGVRTQFASKGLKPFGIILDTVVGKIPVYPSRGVDRKVVLLYGAGPKRDPNNDGFAPEIIGEIKLP